jgi:hypothetical protein
VAKTGLNEAEASERVKSSGTQEPEAVDGGCVARETIIDNVTDGCGGMGKEIESCGLGIFGAQ